MQLRLARAFALALSIFVASVAPAFAQQPAPVASLPAGFPVPPGGTLQPAPPGPTWVHVTVLRYAAPAQALTAQLRAMLQQSGWAIASESVAPRGGLRMQTSRNGQSASVSVMTDGAATVLLVTHFTR